MKDVGECSFCLDRVQSINTIIKKDKKCYEDIYECGKRHLQDEIICNDSFDWFNSEGVLSPFCGGCFKSAEEIHRTSQELEKLQEILIKLIKTFKSEVKQRFSKNANHSSTKTSVQPPVSISHTQKSDLIENIDANFNFGSSTQLHSTEDGEFDEVSDIKSENEKNEVVVKDEDSFLDEELYNVDFTDGISGLEVPLGSESEGEQPKQEPEYILNRDEPVDGQWPRVILERLKCDKNGQIISSKIRQLSKRHSRKGNAAAKASDDAQKPFRDFGTKYDSTKKYFSRNGRFSFKQSSHVKVHVDAVHKKILKHKCSTCGKYFGTRRNLKRHEELHKKDSEREKFKCKICGDKYFTQRIALTLHQKKWHTVFTNGPITCDKCHNKFPTSSEFFMHSRRVSSDRQRQCEFCAELFYTRCELLCHITEWHPSEDKPNQCKNCSIVFKSLRALQKHSVDQHSISIEHGNSGTEIINCDECGKEIKKHSMKWHKQTHLRLSFLCKLCGKSLTSKKGLVRHEELCGIPKTSSMVTEIAKKISHQKKFYECDICGEKMASRKRKNHVARHLGETPGTILCPVCGNHYSKEYFYQRHEKLCQEGKTPRKTPTAVKEVLQSLEAEKSCTTIGVENPGRSKLTNIYKCNFCDRCFKCPAHVKIHARSHTGEKPFTCDTCGKSFTTKAFLSVHLRIHSVEKLFCCAICGKSFNQSGNLKQHMLTHTEERPHKCPHCEKSFKKKPLLKIHVRIHTGEKPYSCNICSKSFSDRSTWQRHEKAHK